MLILKEDERPEGTPEGATTGWTLLCNEKPIGRMWKSRYGDTYTLHINGVSITEPNQTDALDRARRYLGLDAEGAWPLPGWERATDEKLPTVGEHVLIYRSHDDHPGWVIGKVWRVEPGAVDVSFKGAIVGGGRFQPSQIARAFADGAREAMLDAQPPIGGLRS